MVIGNPLDRKHPDDTKNRIMASALKILSKNGYRGATIREITIDAGVTEITIFRNFGTKDNLLVKAIEKSGNQMLSAIPEPTGIITNDIRMLSVNLTEQFTSTCMQLIRILPEIEEQSEIKRMMIRIKDIFYEKLLAFLSYYNLVSDTDNSGNTMILNMFIGPIMIYTLDVPQNPQVFDHDKHVELFLNALRH